MIPKRKSQQSLIVFAAIGIAIAAGCQKAPPPAAPPPPEVDVAHPLIRQVAEWDEYTGRLAAVEEVEVRARVSGYLDAVNFTPGQIVQKGDLLFTIDARPFEAEVARVRAELSAAEADAEHAAFDLTRIERLREREVAPEKEYRDALYQDLRAKAELERVKAELRTAELNLIWSRIESPITGRISRERVTVGNLVSGGSVGATLLTTIVSMNPIYCYFDVSEQDYLKYARLHLSGERVSSRDSPNPVRVALMDENDFRHAGRMDFVENMIDQQTGTLRGRALLANPEDLLLPGLFVRLRLIGTGSRPTLCIPDAAVGADQTNRVVFVIDENGIARQRQVKLGRLLDGLRVITEGLTADDRVVVNGIQRVRPGAPVNAVEVTIENPGDDAVTTVTTRPATSQPATQPFESVIGAAR